jgi:hypothetical protein
VRFQMATDGCIQARWAMRWRRVAQGWSPVGPLYGLYPDAPVPPVGELLRSQVLIVPIDWDGWGRADRSE